MPRPHSVDFRSEAADRLIVALDFPAAGPALAFASRLARRARWVKVGLELFVAAGPDVVRHLREAGFEVFLDLKLHDIPNTVAGAVRSAAGLGASLLTVHAGGGPAMLRAAAEAQATTAGAPQLLAVTVLTSMDAAQLSATGVADAPAAQVLRLGRLAVSCGIGGLVCSPEEAGALRSALPAETMLVTPGIRPAGAAQDDQSRIATPARAIASGASKLVVGRPITQATDPAAAVEAILAEMEDALRQHA